MTTEELLNKLIEMGWKPWGKEKCYFKNTRISEWLKIYYELGYIYMSFNDLCSIDSGLRQFVVEKWLDKWYNGTASIIQNNWIWYWEKSFVISSTEYRLMLSSIQEDKAKFILEFIKWEWKQ